MKQRFPNDSDHDLIQAIAHGDNAALAMLYARHGLKLLSYLNNRVSEPTLAEELLQDVMLAVWKGAIEFRGDSQVYTWMLSIARHKAINASQRHKLLQEPLSDHLPEPDLEYSDTSEIQAALGHLSKSQWETLELIFYHNLSGVEAAQVLNVPVGTIKSRLHRALALLRTRLKIGER